MSVLGFVDPEIVIKYRNWYIFCTWLWFVTQLGLSIQTWTKKDED